MKLGKFLVYSICSIASATARAMNNIVQNITSITHTNFHELVAHYYAMNPQINKLDAEMCRNHPIIQALRNATYNASIFDPDSIISSRIQSDLHTCYNHYPESIILHPNKYLNNDAIAEDESNPLYYSVFIGCVLFGAMTAAVTAIKWWNSGSTEQLIIDNHALADTFNLIEYHSTEEVAVAGDNIPNGDIH